MEVSIKFEDNLISDDQAETFAYNIYRDIAEYMKDNYEDFFEWNLEKILIGCVMTLDKIIHIGKKYKYDLCIYEKTERSEI